MPQPVNNNKVSTTQAAADQEAAALIMLFDTNKIPGIQPDEVTVDFVLQFMKKPEGTRRAIINKLAKDVLDYLSDFLSLIASGRFVDNKITRDIVRKAAGFIKFRHENSSSGKASYSYLPLRPAGRSTNQVRVIRVYC